MDRENKIIEQKIFHFVCKMHFQSTQEDDLLFFPPYFEKKKTKKLCQNEYFSVTYN